MHYYCGLRYYYYYYYIFLIFCFIYPTTSHDIEIHRDAALQTISIDIIVGDDASDAKAITVIIHHTHTQINRSPRFTRDSMQRIAQLCMIHLQDDC